LIITDFKIAGLIYKLKSDVKIQGLKNDRFQKFKVKTKNYDIFHTFQNIPQIPDSFPPLNKEEKNLLKNCEIFPYFNNTDSPILRFPIIRDQLNDCKNRINEITLEIKHSYLSIFDFSHNKIDCFYTNELKSVLKNSRMGSFVFAQFLPNFSATMIHSSAVIIENKAAVFLAPDEGGKTTAAELASGFPILCDDQNVIRKQGNKFITHSTPWGLHIDNSIKASVGAFFLLEKGKNFKLTLLKPKDLLYYFWNEHLAYYLYLPKYLKSKHFNFLFNLSNQVPVYKLQFSKDYIDWDAIANLPYF